MIIENDDNGDKIQVSVADCLLKPTEHRNLNINSKSLYFISRGCIYEHNKSCFKLEGLARTFTKNNEKLMKG